MSPYVVTTKHLTPDGLGVTQPNERRAVATREDAAQAVFDICEERYPLSELSEALARDLVQTPTTTTYPLPDGTVIEVERAEWADLAESVDWLGLGYVTEEQWPEVLVAFNAQEATR